MIAGRRDEMLGLGALREEEEEQINVISDVRIRKNKK
jgi:hypothetical protein